MFFVLSHLQWEGTSKIHPYLEVYDPDFLPHSFLGYISLFKTGSQDSVDNIVAEQIMCSVLCWLTEEKKENFPEYDLLWLGGAFRG